MVSRIINSFFIGLALVLILDFLYFIGLKIHYFDFYKITEYFNVYFVDNQNFYFLGISSLIVGYLLLYSSFAKIFAKLYVVIVIIFGAMLYEPVGNMVAKYHLLKENQRFKLGQTTFTGDLLYMGRENIYIYRKDIAKTIKLSRNEVKILTAF